MLKAGRSAEAWQEHWRLALVQDAGRSSRGCEYWSLGGILEAGRSTGGWGSASVPEDSSCDSGKMGRRSEYRGKRETTYVKSCKSKFPKNKPKGAVEQHNSLNLGFLNVDGMSETTFLDVKRTVQTRNLDIVGFVESKRRLEQVSTDISIKGFNKIEVMRSDAANDREGGGIVVYSRVTQGMKVERLSPVIVSKENYFVDKERVWLLASTTTSKTAVCIAYFGCQYPDNRYEVWNQSMYDVISREVFEFEAMNYRVVVLADFNGHIGSAAGVGIPGNKHTINRNGSMLLSFSLASNMKILNRDCRTEGDVTTRLSKGLWTWMRAGKTSVIDYALISANHISSVLSMDIDDGGVWGGGSDHNWIFVALKDKISRLYIPKKKKVPKISWDIKEDQDWSSYKRSLNLQVSSIDKTTVSSFANSLLSVLYTAAKETIGVKSSTGEPKPCTYPQEIVIELATKRRLERLWKTAQALFSSTHPPGTAVPPSILVKEKDYLDQKLHVSNLIAQFRSEKRKEEVDLCTGDTAKSKKRFWSHVTSKKVKGSSDIPAVRSPVSGELKTDPKEIIAETETHLKSLFHGSFANILPESYERENFSAPHQKEHSYSSKSTQVLKCSGAGSGLVHDDPSGFLDADISYSEIQDMIGQLDSGKASGLDGLPNEFLKALPLYYKSLLREPFNMVKESGVLPKGWNSGRLVLIHKKDEAELLTNYRPLTVINSIPGLYAKILNARLAQVVEAHNLLGEVQTGFRKERCCADNTFVLNTLMWKLQSLGGTAHMAFVDIEKV